MHPNHHPLHTASPGLWLGRLLSLLCLFLLLSIVSPVWPGQPAVGVADAAGARAGQTPSESWLITWDASTDGTGSSGGRSITRQSKASASIVVNYYADGSSDYYANKYTATFLVDELDDYDCDEGGHYRYHYRAEVTDPTRYNGTGPVTPQGIMPYKPTVWTGTRWTLNGMNLVLGPLAAYFYEDTTACDGAKEHWDDTSEDLVYLEHLTSYVRSPFNSDDGPLFLYDVDTQFDVTEFTITYPLHLKEHVRVELLHGLDLTVNDIEVTQGLQLGNTIPLVQGRRTIVRAYVGIGINPGPIAGVTGRLRVYNGATLLGELAPFNMAGSISAKRAPDWRKIDDTLNFELPSSWTKVPSLRFEVEVNPTREIGEIDYADNTRSVELLLRDCAPLKIGYLPVRFAPPGVTPASPDADIARAQEWMRKVYPVADDELLYRPLPGITWDKPIDTETDGEEYLKGADLLEKLGKLLPLSKGAGVDRLVGWLPATASQKLHGMADNIPGQVAWVAEKKTPKNIWRMELAHELGHTYGAEHTFATTRGYHWFDVYERSIKPELSSLGLVDFMWGTDPFPEEDDWVSPDTYNTLYQKGGFCFPRSNTVQSPQQSAATDVLVISGDVSMTTTPSGQLDPLYRAPGTELIPPVGTSYYVVLKNGTTELGKYGFDAELGAQGTQVYTPTIAPFVLAVPYPAGLNRVDLTDRYGNTLTSRIASAHPPTVTVQFPNVAGLTLDGVQTIRWAGSDPDGEALSYSVLYSKDNGVTWNAIGADITGTSYAVDFAAIPGGSTALIKVLASDGFNTASDVSDQPFAVPAKPPVAVIVSPPAGAHFKVGERIKLQGLAVDLEEGMVASGSLSWSSNLDGALGTGSTLEVTLSKGTHTIKLQVPGGAASTTTVVVETPLTAQQSHIYLPVVVR